MCNLKSIHRINMGIIIENLSFSYSKKYILNDINLVVKPGDNIGIVGISGGGKSTLLKLVSGLYDLQTGNIVVAGAKRSAHRRQNVAMVMQNAALFPASIRDNITCGHDMDETVLLGACDNAQLTDWIATLPHGIDTFVGERNGNVSGGQAQRIAIARAIAKDSPIVLLDEPTSALDSDTSSAVIGALQRLTKDKTVLHVSHKLETLTKCNRIYRLEGGRLYDM